MNLYYFTPPEFERGGRNWYAAMDPRLLILMDVFRHRWGRTVEISPHPKALGRHMGEALSDHNIDKWGAVLAADVFPAGMIDRREAERAIKLARELGFTSFGVYPDWKPQPGLHLGTRRETHPGSPATWGAVNENGKQTYCGLDQALACLP